jgi:hypothetical protein
MAEFGQENAEIIAKVGIVIGAFAGAIVVANIALKAFRTVMLIVKAATLLFNIVLAANPIVLITLAVIALIAIFVALEMRFGFVSAAIKKLGEFFQGVFRLISRGFEALVRIVRNFGRFLQQHAQLIFNILTWPFQLMRKVVSGDFDQVIGFVRSLPGRIGAFVSAILGRLREPFTNARNWASDRFNDMVAFVRGLPARIGAFVNSIRDKMIEPFNKARDLIESGIDGLVGTLRGLPGRISNAVSGAFNGLWRAFGGAINRIIRAWNGLSFTMGGFTAFGVTSPSFTISTPNIPTIALAEGGIVRAPTTALIGEAGPEAVIPLDRFGSLGGITINVSGSVITEGNLIETVRRGLVQSQRSGRRLTI